MAAKSIDEQIAELNAKRNERDRPKVEQALAVLDGIAAQVEEALGLVTDLPADGPFITPKRAIVTLASTLGHARTSAQDAIAKTLPQGGAE